MIVALIFTCILVVIFFIWSLVFFKSYQLNQYKIKKFLDDILLFHFSFGDKNKIIWTKRFVRFSIVYVIFSFLIFFLITYFIKIVALVILNIIVIFLLSPLLVCIVHFFMLPTEQFIKQIYILRAKAKLKKKKIIKIGITGSYGKTSTKNILTHILEKQYKVCVTPLNYNTEMGITKTILDKLDDHDIFIAEMGARKKYDIKKVADIVRPDIAIITTIGKAHLESFKTISEIEKTKFELCESLQTEGKAIFNGDSKSTTKLYKKFKGNKFLTNIPQSFAYAQNIKCSNKGSDFDLVIDGKVLKVHTRLLGEININNIVTASACAYILQVPQQDIIDAILTLPATEHRLQIIRENPVVIDDSYNSNEIGFKQALEVLTKFKGKKIVVTPGIVELGKEQSTINFKLGSQIADVADFIIIMNEVNKNDLYCGAISHNFNRKNIFFANTRKKQQEILQLLVNENSIVLFENDLPDNYK